MPDKEFEAKVRDSLETLHLEPSPQVWKAVSGQIRTRKRRRILFWLPLVVMLTGLGWWSIWYSRQEEAGQTAGSRPAANEKADGQIKGNRATTGRYEAGQPQGGRSGEGRSAAGQAGVPQSGAGRSAAGQAGVPQSGAGQPGAPWTLLVYNTGLPPDPYAFNPSEAFPGAILPLFSGIEPAKTAKDSAGKPGDLSKKPGKRPAWHKWQSRVYAGGGIAGQGQFARFYTPRGTGSGLSSVGNPASASGSGSNAGIYTTAARQAGAGLGAGFAEQYRFARHWKIQAGLEYDYWETAFGKVDLDDVNYLGASSSLPSQAVYVASYTGQTYVNRYSLFQLPLGISWLMAPSRRWNPSLYTGISVGYLSGKHVLQYTPDSVTYRAAPPDLLRHWSVYWKAGLDIDVYHWGTNVLYLGPVIEYGLSGLQTQGSVKDHLNYAGLRLGIGFR